MKNQVKYQEIDYNETGNDIKQTDYNDDPQTTERNLGNGKSSGAYSGLPNQTMTGDDGDTERRFSQVTNNNTASKDTHLKMKNEYGRSSHMLETTTKALKYQNVEDTMQDDEESKGEFSQRQGDDDDSHYISSANPNNMMT